MKETIKGTTSQRSVVMFCLVAVWLFCGRVEAIEISESLGDHVECERSKVDHNVTLASGHHAGSFLKANQSIQSMDRCVEQVLFQKGRKKHKHYICSSFSFFKGNYSFLYKITLFRVGLSLF